METQQSQINPVTPEPTYQRGNMGGNNSGRIFGGLIVVIVGAVLLADRMGVFIPWWLTSWPMILIAVGLFIGVRHNFRNPGWIVPTIIGVVFMIDKASDVNLVSYFWPVFIIGIGLYMILKSRKKSDNYFTDKWNKEGIDGNENVLDCVTIFGGVKKNIISKDFKGGEAVTIFGGTELNLTQADSSGKIVLELVQLFGGTKLIVPPHWKVHAEEVVSIFGGLDDKRPPVAPPTTGESRVLVLKGTCIFGGIDIKSF